MGKYIIHSFGLMSRGGMRVTGKVQQVVVGDRAPEQLKRALCAAAADWARYAERRVDRGDRERTRRFVAAMMNQALDGWLYGAKGKEREELSKALRIEVLEWLTGERIECSTKELPYFWIDALSAWLQDAGGGVQVSAQAGRELRVVLKMLEVG